METKNKELMEKVVAESCELPAYQRLAVNNFSLAIKIDSPSVGFNQFKSIKKYLSDNLVTEISEWFKGKGYYVS